MPAADVDAANALGWRRRLLSGRALWSGVDAAASPATALLLAAGLVRTLGASDYGLIVMALAVSALSTSVSPAIAATTTRFVSEVSATPAMQAAVSRILTGSLLTVAVMDLLLLSIAAGFAGPLSVAVFGHTIAGRPDIIPIMLLAVASLCVQQIDGVFAAALKGLLKFRPQAVAEVLCRLVLVILVIAAARLSGSVKVTLLVYCVSFGIACIVRFNVVKRSLNVRRLLLRPHAADMKKLMGFSGWMWLNAIATMAYGSVDRIIVGRVSGTTAMAEFNVYMQLAQLVHFIPASLFAYAYPVFGALGINVRSHAAQIRFLYSRYFARCILISLSIAAVLLIVMRPLLRILTAGALPLSHESAFILLIVNFLILSVSIIPYYATLGLGSARSVSLVSSVSMLVSLGMTVVLTPRLGLEGAVFARLAYAVGVLSLYVLLRRVFKSASAVPHAVVPAL
jgi:O-antigen/teichoic acid export membrane protein